MIPYAELSDALERYRSRMGLAPSGSALSAGSKPAAEPAAAAPAWSPASDDQTSVSGRGAIPPAMDEPMDEAVDPPSGAVDVGDMDILDEEPS